MAFTKKEKICIAILVFSAFLKLLYAAWVPYHISCHDLGMLSEDMDYGHLGYIQYIYRYRQLPDFTPIGNYQFYHPPFFHIIGALTLALAGGDGIGAFELLQYVNMGFAILGVVYIYRIIRFFAFDGRTECILTLFAAFFPSFYHMGAALNNDCLMTLLCIMAVYYTLVWSRKQTVCTIVKIALAMGFAMFTKTSAGLVAPCIAVVFLYALVCGHKDFRKIFIQLCLFALICVPIGMFWTVREKVLFDVPLNYVQRLSETSSLYVGDVSLIRRLGLPSVSQVTEFAFDYKRAEEFGNIWGQTIMSMLFDEKCLYMEGRLRKLAGLAFYFVAYFMVLILVKDTVQSWFHNKNDLIYRLMSLTACITLFGSYMVFCFQYPFLCTMNFRYIAVLLVFWVLGQGFGMQCRKPAAQRTNWQRLLYNFEDIAMIGFSGLSAVVFLVCA